MSRGLRAGAGEAFLRHHRRAVLAVGLLVAIVSAAALPFVRFDFNPLHLKSQKVESMASGISHRSCNWTPDTLNVLAPSFSPYPNRSSAAWRARGACRDIAQFRARQAAGGSRSSWPAQRSAFARCLGRFAAIGRDLQQALAETAAALRQVVAANAQIWRREWSVAWPMRSTGCARRHPMCGPLRRLVVVVPLGVMLERPRAMLQASPRRRSESLPRDIISDWVTSDGRARIQVFLRPELDTDDGLWRFARAVQAVAPMPRACRSRSRGGRYDRPRPSCKLASTRSSPSC